jgi:hypothetical protein
MADKRSIEIRRQREHEALIAKIDELAQEIKALSALVRGEAEQSAPAPRSRSKKGGEV